MKHSGTKLVELYKEYRERYGYFSRNLDYKKANKSYKQAQRVHLELKVRDSLHSLLPLLKDENEYVRVGAAKGLLPYYESECKNVLDELEHSNNPEMVLNAKMVWDQWIEGTLDPEK